MAFFQPIPAPNSVNQPFSPSWMVGLIRTSWAPVQMCKSELLIWRKPNRQDQGDSLLGGVERSYINETKMASVYWPLGCLFLPAGWDLLTQKPASAKFKISTSNHFKNSPYRHNFSYSEPAYFAHLAKPHPTPLLAIHKPQPQSCYCSLELSDPETPYLVSRYHVDISFLHDSFLPQEFLAFLPFCIVFPAS